MEGIHEVILAISDFLYQPFIVPLLLFAAGVYFTFLLGIPQIGMLREACKVILEKPKNKEGISSFGALMVSTASRVGTGNIIGVSAAICTGGPGAVFWMWITAILGGSSAFVESTLAQIYKKKSADGSSFGGPAYYMQDALKQRWLGCIFAFLILLTYAVGYNMLAAYNLQSTFAAFKFYDKTTTPMIIGAILTVLFAMIILGGGKRLLKVTALLVPVMGVVYVAVSIIVILLNIGNVPAMFGEIFANAFDFQAIFGGFTGSCIMLGVKRGLYSNEAGMGSAPNAAATADVSHPVKQGLVQMISVFIDTLIICTATALMCLSTGVAHTKEVSGAAYVQNAVQSTLGDFGPIFIAVAMCLFAFTTLIGNYSYCEGCIKFILKSEPSKELLMCFRVFSSILIYVGTVSNAGLVWDLADMCQGLMVVTNVPAILLLGGVAAKCLKDYTKQLETGKNPHYVAKEAGLKEETDFWN